MGKTICPLTIYIPPNCYKTMRIGPRKLELWNDPCWNNVKNNVKTMRTENNLLQFSSIRNCNKFLIFYELFLNSFRSPKWTANDRFLTRKRIVLNCGKQFVRTHNLKQFITIYYNFTLFFNNSHCFQKTMRIVKKQFALFSTI